MYMMKYIHKSLLLNGKIYVVTQKYVPSVIVSNYCFITPEMLGELPLSVPRLSHK